MTREQLFLSQLPDIERVIGWVCRRRCLRGADAEDFASAVKLRLIENDYEKLAKFEARSSLRTYLAVVINRLYLDFQIRRFGKWRTSAEARRLGPVAERLECLLYRDGLTFHEACGVLGSDPRVGESRDELHEISLRLPHRSRRRQGTTAPEANGPPTAASDVERSERQALADRFSAVIRSSLAGLPANERLVLQLYLVEGLTLAQVSRSFGLDQKALYRKKEELFKRLRADVEAAGIGSGDAKALLSVVDWDAAFFDSVATGAAGSEPVAPRPSPPTTDASRREGEW